MVVPTQGLTSLSPSGVTLIGLQARPGVSLAWISAGEPLNPMPSSQMGIGEGRSNPGFRPGGPNRLRVPVVDSRGFPLMPCKPVRAKLLLKREKAVARWSKLGIFYIQLKHAVEPNNQTLAVGIDPGPRFEGFSAVGTKDTVLNIMHEAVDWVKKAIEQRRQMRRARRYRKTRRECRFDNRLRTRDSLRPSTKARWDAKLRILEQLKEMIPIQTAALEDVSAKAREGLKRWNTSLSPLEVRKRYFTVERGWSESSNKGGERDGRAYREVWLEEAQEQIQAPL